MNGTRNGKYPGCTELFMLLVRESVPGLFSAVGVRNW